MKPLCKQLVMFLSIFLFNSLTFAGNEGGGGEELEMRIDNIRSDLFKWINEGGSKSLQLPLGTTVEDYNRRMLQVLTPQAVVVGFVSDDLSLDIELRVEVDGRPKTCRGFRSEKDHKLHILCNTLKFEKTTPAGQYRLIHHEYAGLAELEKNEGAASDYKISNQLTDYLEEQTVLKLAVKKVSPNRRYVKCSNFSGTFQHITLPQQQTIGLLTEIWKITQKGCEVIKIETLTKSGFKFKNYDYSNSEVTCNIEGAVLNCNQGRFRKTLFGLVNTMFGYGEEFHRRIRGEVYRNPARFTRIPSRKFDRWKKRAL